ncbi:hypothetical protein ACFP3I_05425 [Chryseobacterium arachidis]|uniref:hypothetical protein n=1 Tax=Chryseobacterium arachidis TaxID=1416778 RepID=UPI00360F992B
MKSTRTVKLPAISCFCKSDNSQPNPNRLLLRVDTFLLEEFANPFNKGRFFLNNSKQLQQ